MSPQRAAETVPGGEHLPERSRVVRLALPPPALAIFWPRGAMVRGLGKSHGDAHPLVTQVRAEASLPPAAGTACAAACIVAINVHHQPLEFHTKKATTRQRLSGNV